MKICISFTMEGQQRTRRSMARVRWKPGCLARVRFGGGRLTNKSLEVPLNRFQDVPGVYDRCWAGLLGPSFILAGKGIRLSVFEPAR